MSRDRAAPEIVAAARELRRAIYAAASMLAALPEREIEPLWLRMARALAAPVGDDTRDGAVHRFQAELYLVQRMLGRGGRCGSLAADQAAGRRVAEAMEMADAQG